MTRFADQHFSRSVLCNFADINPSGLARKIGDIVRAEYAGAYLSSEIDPVVSIAVQNGSVLSTCLKRNPDALRPAIRDIFVRDTGKIAFTRGPGGKVSGFLFDADRIQNVNFPKKAN